VERFAHASGEAAPTARGRTLPGIVARARRGLDGIR